MKAFHYKAARGVRCQVGRSLGVQCVSMVQRESGVWCGVLCFPHVRARVN